MPQPAAPIPVFCSFAPEDEPLCLELERSLKPLQRQALLTLWHRGHIPGGTDQASAVTTALTNATLILLLISPDYLASDDCFEVELAHAMQRHEAGTARVIPILLRPIEDREATPFGHLTVLPTNALPLARWPDRDEAFADVVAGIRRAISDLPARSLGPSPVPLRQVWTIPYPRNPVFTGREALLAHLATQLQAGQTMALTQPSQAISGLGGVGKTQLAVEYAYQHRADYQAVLWARAESTETLTSSCVALAKELNLSQKDERDTALIIAAVQRWLRSNTGWLLILDNADDLAVVREFLPPDYKGHVLLTTRAQAMGRLAQRLDVDTLPADLGALFLLRRAGLLAPTASLDQASPTDREIAQAITRELGGLPLALDQAGAYIEETGCSLADYQQFYQHHRADLLKERRGQVADHPEAVATTWSLAFERVEQAQPAAADLLRLCAFLAPDAIPEELLTQGAAHLGPGLAPVAADSFRLNQAIEVLRAYSLLARDPTTRTVNIHRLVQAVLIDAMSAETARRWKERVVQAVNAAFPDVALKQWERCKRLLPHALICATWSEQEHMTTPEVTRLLTETGSFLPLVAQDIKAESLLEYALAIREQQLGKEHPDTIQSLNNLVLFYYDRGDFEWAEPVLGRALSIREKQTMLEHPDVASILHDLTSHSHTYDQEGVEQAESLVTRTLAMCEQLGPLHPDIASILYELGDLYIVQQKYGQARWLRKYALVIYVLPFRLRDINTAYELRALAFGYHDQGKDEQAELLYTRALAIFEAFDKDDQGKSFRYSLTAMSLNDLAIFYCDQEEYERAEPLFRRALAICKQQLGREHPKTRIVQGNDTLACIVQGNFALCLRALGRTAEADQVEARGVRRDDPQAG